MMNITNMKKILKRKSGTYILPGTVTIDGITYYEKNRFEDETEYNLALSIIPKIAKRKKDIGKEEYEKIRQELIAVCFNWDIDIEGLEKEFKTIWEKLYGKKLYPEILSYWKAYKTLDFKKYITHSEFDKNYPI